MKFETLIKQLIRGSLKKANARKPNACDDCGNTWTPRGKDLSSKCPNCQSQNVKLLVPETLGCGGVLTKFATCGVICFFVFIGIAIFAGIFGDPPDRKNNPKKKVANTKKNEGQNPNINPKKDKSSKAPKKASDANKSPGSTPKNGTKPVKKRLINYEIIKRDKVPKFKESYDIRVGLVDGRLPNKEELATISAKLRNKSFDKTFVCFYLPGMVVDAGAFAIAHHDPDTRPVKIITAGLPAKYIKLLQAADAELVEKDKGFPDKLLGSWVTDDGKRMIIKKNEIQHILPSSTFTNLIARVEPIDDGYRTVVIEYGKEYPQNWKVADDQFSITSPKAFITLLGSPYKRATRTWNDSSGKFSVKGEYASYANGKVVIRKADGEEIKVPVERLSEEDKEFLRKLFRNKGVKPGF